MYLCLSRSAACHRLPRDPVFENQDFHAAMNTNLHIPGNSSMALAGFHGSELPLSEGTFAPVSLRKLGLNRHCCVIRRHMVPSGGAQDGAARAAASSATARRYRGEELRPAKVMGAGQGPRTVLKLIPTVGSRQGIAIPRQRVCPARSSWVVSDREPGRLSAPRPKRPPSAGRCCATGAARSSSRQ
jgi:hypothetical protein